MTFHFERVLVALEGDEGAERTLECGVALGGELRATVTVLAVAGRWRARERRTAEDSERTEQLLALARAAAERHDVVVDAERFVGGAQQVGAIARSRDHDLIVLSRRSSFLADLVLGAGPHAAAPARQPPGIVVE